MQGILTFQHRNRVLLALVHSLKTTLNSWRKLILSLELGPLSSKHAISSSSSNPHALVINFHLFYILNYFIFSLKNVYYYFSFYYFPSIHLVKDKTLFAFALFEPCSTKLPVLYFGHFLGYNWVVLEKMPLKSEPPLRIFCVVFVGWYQCLGGISDLFLASRILWASLRLVGFLKKLLTFPFFFSLLAVKLDMVCSFWCPWNCPSCTNDSKSFFHYSKSNSVRSSTWVHFIMRWSFFCEIHYYMLEVAILQNILMIWKNSGEHNSLLILKHISFLNCEIIWF